MFFEISHLEIRKKPKIFSRLRRENFSLKKGGSFINHVCLFRDIRYGQILWRVSTSIRILNHLLYVGWNNRCFNEVCFCVLSKKYNFPINFNLQNMISFIASIEKYWWSVYLWVKNQNVWRYKCGKRYIILCLFQNNGPEYIFRG